MDGSLRINKPSSALQAPSPNAKNASGERGIHFCDEGEGGSIVAALLLGVTGALLDVEANIPESLHLLFETATSDI